MCYGTAYLVNGSLLFALVVLIYQLAVLICPLAVLVYSLVVIVCQIVEMVCPYVRLFVVLVCPLLVSVCPFVVLVWPFICRLLVLVVLLSVGLFITDHYKMRNIFLQKSSTKCGVETIPRHFSKKSKLSISLDQ